MGLLDWFRGGSSGVGADGLHQTLDREATSDDLAHLRSFARTRTGVAFYLEPETAATDTTVVAVAADGEWTRRRVGTPRAARRLGRRAGVAVHDVTVTGYPAAMRAWNARAKADREALAALDPDRSDPGRSGPGRSGPGRSGPGRAPRRG